LLFRWWKRKLTRSVIVENAVGQARPVGPMPRKEEDQNFFQKVNSNPNPGIRIPFKTQNLIILEVRFMAYKPFFLNLFITLYFWILLFYFTLLFKILLSSIWTNNFYISINCIFFKKKKIAEIININIINIINSIITIFIYSFNNIVYIYIIL